MGIGATVKNILTSSDGTTVDNTGDRRSTNPDETKDSSKRSSRQLPPGTGPGTSGKPGALASEVAMQHDLERARAGHGISGYGTDAAAAAGGTLAGTHQGKASSPAASGLGSGVGTGPLVDATSGSGPRTSTIGAESPSQALPVTYTRASESSSDTGPARELAGGTTTTYRESGSHGLGGVLEDAHEFGHTKRSAPDSMPSGRTQDENRQLHPIYHENVRHLEVEEISYVKDRERHIHHIQHHVQPVILTEEQEERLRENVHPITHVKEIHANKPEDSTVFEKQIFQNTDSLSHAEKERTIINKGTTVHETVHHHIHHVIQPVIEKQTIQKERIRSTIPIREVTQEAPVVHQSQFHDPVAVESFVKGGGSLQGGVQPHEIIRQLMHSGKCVREIKSPVTESSLGDKNKIAKGTTTNIDEDSVLPQKGGQRKTSLDQPKVVPTKN